mmetsp:Transcript_15238/g.33350  ORF Transcript_15238/g.33350 Transcript_15238/m.33350 type:complete len:465 (+) Transcript_15238:237-1631(+)|eukprot:CAMPEP_0168736500 /NCGR_PEP_ID=MMETSP0724-20121128/9893_1 /TAXON_ID=265536 /ORGANISM="Amphiprora sp., Strain CCMP467" /LENGTH=464 /DNA_ID=CAMNT_0008783701 /DNA_START=691 /DNA_END=2085 /DNA_ORIENTATION=-
MEALERQEPTSRRGDVLRLSPDQALEDIFRLSLRHRTAASTTLTEQEDDDETDCNTSVILPEEQDLAAVSLLGLRKRTAGIPSAATQISPASSTSSSNGHQDVPQLPVASTLPRPVRKRTKSWSSEGQVHRIEDDDDGEDDSIMMRLFEEEEEDDDFLMEGSSFEFLLRPPPRLSSQRKITPAALALQHGNSLMVNNQKPLSAAAAHNTAITSAVASPKQQHAPLRNPTRWLIPVNHPIKILWDVLTVVLSIYNVYCTHAAIRDRQFQTRPGFIEAWFLVDILLNFCTQRTTPEGVLVTWQQVWGRYLTSWFVVDVLALFPGEVLYIQPLIELQRKRKLHQKILRRTKVAVKVTTRILKTGHVPWLYRAIAKASARPLREIVTIIKVCVKYVPKYLLFVRNMKGWILVRVLRDVGHVRMAWRHANNKDAATVDLTEEGDDAAPQERWEGLQEEEENDDDDYGPY